MNQHSDQEVKTEQQQDQPDHPLNEAKLEQPLVELVNAIKAEKPSKQEEDQMSDHLQKLIRARGHQLESIESSPKPKVQLDKPLTLAKFFNFPVRVAGSFGVAVAVVASLMFVSIPTNNAFAAVIANINQISSMFYTSKMTSNDNQIMDLKVYYRSTGQLRVETQPINAQQQGGMVNVIDVNQAKGVIFFPEIKKAVPFDFAVEQSTISPKDDPLYWYETLKNYQGEPSEYLKARQINNVYADGFVIKDNGVTITVWSNVDTLLPVKVIVALEPINGQVPFEIEADLLFNQAFNDDLFSLEIGEDYLQLKADEH